MRLLCIWNFLRSFPNDILLRMMCLYVSTSLRRIFTANTSTRSHYPPNWPKLPKLLNRRSLTGAPTWMTYIFSKKTHNVLPPHQSYDHTIDLKSLFIPKITKVYPLNLKEQEACKAFIDEHLKTRRIVPSKSPQAAPFFFIAKKDGSLCPCQDYCYLNSHTVRNAYPLPLRQA